MDERETCLQLIKCTKELFYREQGYLGQLTPNVRAVLLHLSKSESMIYSQLEVELKKLPNVTNLENCIESLIDFGFVKRDYQILQPVNEKKSKIVLLDNIFKIALLKLDTVGVDTFITMQGKVYEEICRAFYVPDGVPIDSL